MNWRGSWRPESGGRRRGAAAAALLLLVDSLQPGPGPTTIPRSEQLLQQPQQPGKATRLTATKGALCGLPDMQRRVDGFCSSTCAHCSGERMRRLAQCLHGPRPLFLSRPCVHALIAAICISLPAFSICLCIDRRPTSPQRARPDALGPFADQGRPCTDHPPPKAPPRLHGIGSWP